jgi:hypothetical protein
MNIDIKTVRSIAANVPGERTRTLMLLLCDEIEKLLKEIERLKEAK